MDYFSAVQEGRRRVQAAVDLLQSVAGPSSPVLFLKMETKDWVPVGEENLYTVVEGGGSSAAVVLCDATGNSKAIAGWVPADDAERFAKALESGGLRRFSGEVRLPI